ncbi:MAG TPA: winged helix-turn-helix domain-containing protein [Pyrinomonadaceae bacterium]|jgi:DNA-binding winged helix-turn-helix (wHTH) protein/tetratricopeptide (TPR) repeat protein
MNSRVLRYEFGNYRLLPSERLLYRAGENIPLKSKVFETLLTLVRHPGKLLTKDELMLQIWGNNFVEEANLTQNIFTLRKIFGEKPRDHQFIVTVPGRGYRFVAPVETITEAKIENQADGAIHSSMNGHVKSLAVLPLKFLMPKGTESEKYLGLAIADSLITQLSACRKFAVRSTETVLRYVETEKDAISIGRELDVEVVLSGTIQTLNAKCRANLQLYDTKSGDTLWADKFEVVSDDFFEMQDKISSQAADALVRQGHANLTPRKTPENPEIYQKYIKYRFFWETRTEEGLLASLAGAKEIVAAEPNFALGHVCVADAYLLLGHHLFLPPERVYRNVEQAVEKALELDPDLAEGYASKADLCFISGGWKECEKYHRRAIALKPGYAWARHWYGVFLMAAGRFDESLEQIEESQRLDVNSLYLTVMRGVPFCYKGEFERAIEHFRLVLEIDPDFKRAQYYLAWALFHAGRHEEGIAEFEKVVAAEPIQQAFALLGYCYGRVGTKEKAYEMLRRIDRMAFDGKYVSPYHRGLIYAGLGDKNQALTELEKAYEENSIWLVWLKVDLQFKALRDEPRFKDLIKKLNFPV